MANTPEGKELDRPPYQPWYEGDFWTHRVRHMSPMARLMYRSVLLAAWDLPRPGYIPNDGKTIKQLADCPHPRQWEAYGSEVLAMFDVVEDGSFMTNARQLQELVKAQGKRAANREKGSKGGRPKGSGNPKKTKSGKKAGVFQNESSGLNPESLHPIPSHPNPLIEKLMSTSGEVAAIIRNWGNEEQCMIAEIWPYYLEKCQRDPSRYTLTPERARKALMRFTEMRKKHDSYQAAVIVMKQAIDGLAGNAFNMGDNPQQKRYVDFIDHLFASLGEMEKRLNDTPILNPAKQPRPITNAAVDQEIERQRM
jgi:hypothetical protein